MGELFRAGGFFMWPILASLLLVVGLTVVPATRMFRGGDTEIGELRPAIDAVPFWGAFGAVLGVLGTTAGVAQMADVIERSGGAGSALVWGGVRVSLITTAFGLMVFLVSLVSWYALGAGLRNRQPRRTPGDPGGR